MPEISRFLGIVVNMYYDEHIHRISMSNTMSSELLSRLENAIFLKAAYLGE